MNTGASGRNGSPLSGHLARDRLRCLSVAPRGALRAHDRCRAGRVASVRRAALERLARAQQTRRVATVQSCIFSLSSVSKVICSIIKFCSSF